MFDWIKSLFSKFKRVFKSLLKAAFPMARQIVMGQLAEFGEDVVRSLSKTGLSNEEKRKKAFDDIKEYAVKNGIKARDSLINSLIELIVLKFKEEF